MKAWKTIIISYLVIIAWNSDAQESGTTYDYYPDLSYDLIEDRLSCIESTVPLNFNEKVQSFIEYFTIRDRDYTRQILKRKDIYFPIFEEELAKRGLPDELKYLSIVESGLNPNAISRVGAAGLWQFMPYTGNSFKLHQDWYIDERMDPVESTVAACKFLSQLYSMFGDWELALAAYNCGPGNVRRAIRRSGYKKTFWEIYRYLPRETRSYVPQYVAIIYTLKYAAENNLVVPDPGYLPEYDTVLVSQYFHLETFCDQLNLCMDDLLKLNPHIKRGALPENVKNFPLRVPTDMKEAIVLNRSFLYDTASKVGKERLEYLARNTPGSTYGRERIVYRVRSGDVLGKIAERYHVRVSDLRKWNNINGSMIRVGQRLNIWVLPSYNNNTRHLYASNKPAVQTPSTPPAEVKNGKFYQVQPGDTLWDISRMFEDLTITKLKQLNNLTSNRIKPGQRLLVGSD